MTAEQFYAVALEMTKDGMGDMVRRDLVPDAVEQGMDERLAITLGVSAYNEVKKGEHMRGWLTFEQRDMLDETVDLGLVGEEVAGTEPTTRIGGVDYMAELIQPYIAGQRVTAWDASTWSVVSDPCDYPLPSAVHNGNAWDLDIDFDLAPGWES